MPTTPRAREPDAHRLFFALWPDDAVRAALGDAVDDVPAFAGAGRRTRPDKYHLTLHFLGGWAERPDEVADRAREAAAPVECGAFHLVVDHAGSFARARVGWLAPSGNSGLDALWSSLGHALDDAGVGRRASETFSPHVTVLRALARRVEDTPVEPISWPVEDFVLVHSHAGRYDILQRWSLRSAA